MNEAVNERREQRIVATVGLCGVGKSEASQFLADRLGAGRVYFGGFVADEIRRRGEPVTPQTERIVSHELRQRHGMDVVAQLAVKPIREALNHSGSAVVDGLYSFAEYTFLKDTFGPGLLVVALHARKEVRYARLAIRPERPFARDEVDARDLDEVLRLDKAPLIALADHHIVNDGPIQMLHETLEAILQPHQ